MRAHAARGHELFRLAALSIFALQQHKCLIFSCKLNHLDCLRELQPLREHVHACICACAGSLGDLLERLQVDRGKSKRFEEERHE